MENSSEELKPATEEIVEKIDKELRTHLDKLLGTTIGLEGMPLNIFTIASVILLATRETEIESFPFQPPLRYTDKSLHDELTEISIEPGSRQELIYSQMVEKKYIEFKDNDLIFSKKPTIDMAQIIDRIFPKMPGLNLIAYLGQLIDEVHADRKTSELALSQLNQMLKLQGAPLKAGRRASKSTSTLKLHVKKTPSKKKTISKKPSNLLSQLQARTWAAPSSKAKPQEILTDTNDFSDEQPTIQDHQTGVEQAEGQIPELPGEITTQEPEVSPEVTEIKATEKNQESEQISDVVPTVEAEEPSIIKDESYFSPIEEPKKITEQDIEEKIKAFEKELGIICPLCRKGEISEQKTAKGKDFYHCSNAECVFISWGKPYYLECPQCQNPFLVEMEKSGKSFLKCPRAACPYWQKMPWEIEAPAQVQPVDPECTPIERPKIKRKVRKRRRVVRRRKK